MDLKTFYYVSQLAERCKEAGYTRLTAKPRQSNAILTQIATACDLYWHSGLYSFLYRNPKADTVYLHPGRLKIRNWDIDLTTWTP